MINLMIDGETPSTRSDTCFLTLGAVPFTDDGKILDTQFYDKVDFASIKRNGYHVDENTIAWWSKQPVELFNEAFSGLETPYSLLKFFSAYLDTLKYNYGEVLVWGNGADFDNVILQNMYLKEGLLAPWNFRNNRCFRTLKSLCPEIEIVYEGTKHNALHDARNQAVHAIKCLRKLHGKD